MLAHGPTRALLGGGVSESGYADPSPQDLTRASNLGARWTLSSGILLRRRHDVPATLDTYTEDVVWDDVGHPDCPVRGKDAATGMYEGIMAAIPDLRIESVLRFG